MKKISAVFLVLVMVVSMFSVTAFAATQTETDAMNYYNESGNLITIDGMVVYMFSVTAFAAAQTETDAVNYYNGSGNLITIDGLYYNAQGLPCFNADCYYLDDDGNPVYVGGCRAYCYDINGDFVSCRYYYDTEGSAINPPASYRGGCGYGTWCYGVDGAVENGTFYYDDFGNPVNPPAQSTPRYGRGGGCCGGGGGRWR